MRASTRLLKREWRTDYSGLRLRAFARMQATMFPTSRVGRAALAWLVAKHAARRKLDEDDCP